VVGLWWETSFFRREPLPFDAVGHLPAEAPAALAAERQVEAGRLLAEEAGCVRCHQPGDEDALARGLAPPAAPDLSAVGARAHAGYLERWLEAPKKLRPGATMPELFAAGEAGRVERHAVARYLTSLGGPLRPSVAGKGGKESAVRGERLFATVGCVACHGPAAGGAPPKPPAGGLLYRPARVYPLVGLGSKTAPGRLSAYLRDPLALNPGGHMPQLLLDAREADDLSAFLSGSVVKGLPAGLSPAPGKEQLAAGFKRVDGRADELAAFQKLPPDEQVLDLGKRLVIDRGCNTCHTIAPGGKPFAAVTASATLDDIKKAAKQDAGCLAGEAGKRGSAPDFKFAAAELAALRAFLGRGLSGAGSPAPAYSARLDLQRFNCLACHTRDGEGGLPAEVVEGLRRAAKADSAEAVAPPPLTGVAHKLTAPWLREVLVGAGRARPWLGLRMPQFGRGNVGGLAEGLAALEAVGPDEARPRLPPSAAALAAGRALVGKSGFGCVSCHDLAGVANSGARGPDLAGMSRRVRYEWYRRWLEQPQRLAPGTRMPQVFAGGKSLADGVLGGQAEAQAEALWAYLARR
jgi:mono/diheme cytochrome c family protein